ncbi:MAG: glycosyltransferase family 39 protein [Elainellaceae cyanobacterium]
MKIRSSHVRSYLLVAILFFAAIVRTYRITQPFTDYISWRQSDTATIADNFYRGHWNILYPAISWNGPEPNYVGYEFQTITYITALFYKLLGQHDWIARGVAVMFGLWGIFALYQLVRRVWNEDFAIASAAVMALLPGSIFVERSFLPDPVMVSLVVTSFWMLVAYLQTERMYYLILATAIGSLGFLTKVSGLIVGIPMIHSIVTILAQKQQLRSKRLVFIAIAALIILLPVVTYYFFWAKHISLTYPPYHIAAKGNWLWDDGLKAWLDKKYFLPSMIKEHIRWLWTWPVLFLTIFGLLFPFFRKLHSFNSNNIQLINQISLQIPWLFHWWLLSGVVFYLVGAQELTHNAWNFHIITPAIASLTGFAIVMIVSITTRFFKPIIAGTLALVLFIIIFAAGQKGLVPMYYSRSEHSYKLGMALQQVSQPGDTVITIANDIGDPVALYYSKRHGWIFPPAWAGVAWANPTIEKDDEAVELFEDLRSQGADWFGIVNEQKQRLQQNNKKFFEYIQQTNQLYQEHVEWTIYRVPPTPFSLRD